jgi:hypothetical protein
MASTTSESPKPEKYNLRQKDVARPDGMIALSRGEEEALRKDAKLAALKVCDPLVRGQYSLHLLLGMLGLCGLWGEGRRECTKEAGEGRKSEAQHASVDDFSCGPR